MAGGACGCAGRRLRVPTGTRSASCGVHCGPTRRHACVGQRAVRARTVSPFRGTEHGTSWRACAGAVPRAPASPAHLGIDVRLDPVHWIRHGGGSEETGRGGAGRRVGEGREGERLSTVVVEQRKWELSRGFLMLTSVGLLASLSLTLHGAFIGLPPTNGCETWGETLRGRYPGHYFGRKSAGLRWGRPSSAVRSAATACRAASLVCSSSLKGWFLLRHLAWIGSPAKSARKCLALVGYCVIA